MTGVRNILFVTADQWRGDCLSALGHPCVKTPNLDRLAADGVIFANHYGQASPCGPARASLYTGLYMMNHRSVRNGTPLDARFTNIALETRRAGLDPVLFGYTDVSLDPREYEADDPLLTTYESVLPGMNAEVSLPSDFSRWIEHLRKRGYTIPNDPTDMLMPAANSGGDAAAPAPYRVEDGHTAFLVDEAMHYISGQADQPWFVHLSFLPPHPPLVAPAPFNTAYDPSSVPAPVRAPSMQEEGSQHPWLAYQLGVQLWKKPAANGFGDPGETDHLQLRATYYGLVTELDAQLGRLVDHLKAIGAYDNTLIIITSDHGDQLGDHWLYGKDGYFDRSFHIPLIIRDPGPEANATRGQVIEAFTESVDIMPTVLSRLGLDIPRQCDGESLLPIMGGEQPPGWRDEVHWEFDFRDITGGAEAALGLQPDECTLNVIRGRRYKYVHFTALPPLLFDLAEDPDEFRNLAAESSHALIALEYAQKMLSWRMNHDERTLTGIALGPDGPIERNLPRRASLS